MPAPVIQKGLEGFAEAHAAALDELSRNKVLAHSVNWDTCANAGVLSPSLVAIIKSYDKKPESEKQRILKDNGQQVVEAILSIVAHVKTPDILKYALALADETINFDDKNIGLFLMCQSCTDPLFSILDSPPSDLFTIATAVQVLSHCLVHKSVVPEEDVKRVLRWVSEQLSSKEKDVEIKYLLGSLQVLLRKDKFRVAFLSLDGLHLLGSFLRLEKHFQILYQVIYCIWLLTYNHFVADRVSTTTVIHKIVDVLKNTQKEKVIRVCLAALRNMMDRGENNQQMIEAGLVKLLDLLKQKKWGDEDIVSDLEALLETLSRGLDALSSFNIYKHEVLSGNLEWSPVHRSEKFWKENIKCFEEENFKILHVLHQILRDSANSAIIAVACFDIGEFVRVHPRGRRVVNDLGIKDTVMKLMLHQDAEVQKHALLCIQKLMVNNWEYIQK